MLWIVLSLCVVAIVVYAVVCVIVSWRDHHPPTLGEEGAESFIQFMGEVEELKKREK